MTKAKPDKKVPKVIKKPEPVVEDIVEQTPEPSHVTDVPKVKEPVEDVTIIEGAAGENITEQVQQAIDELPQAQWLPKIGEMCRFSNETENLVGKIKSFEPMVIETHENKGNVVVNNDKHLTGDWTVSPMTKQEYYEHIS